MVLGMPWLESENPVIDWKNRTVEIREKPRKTLSKGKGRNERTLALRFNEPRTRTTRYTAQGKGEPKLAIVREEGPDSRKELDEQLLSEKDRTHPDFDGKKYKEELQESKKALPTELHGHEEVFSSVK